MNARLTSTMTRTTALLAALVATGGVALADVTIPGDVVVAAGATLLINDHTTYSGSLTIEAGAQIVMGANWQIRIGNGATLTVNGTEAEPVEFFRSNGDWSGIRMLTGSTGVMNHAELRDIFQNAISIDDAILTMEGCRIFDESTSSMSVGGLRTAIHANIGAVLTMNNSQIGPFYGKAGANSGSTAGSGSAGSRVYGVYASAAESMTLTNNRFTLVRGGQGGKGGTGSTGSKGANAPDAILFNGVQGSKGGSGGTGGTGGAGGDSFVVLSINTGSTSIVQNIFDVPTGGLAGEGGRGGKGGTGGDGGDGAGGVFGNGGKGGTGGTGGNGGKGGNGGSSGDVSTIYISTPINEPLVANNTFYQVTGRIGGTRGARGSGGNGGTGGAGGGAGIGGSTGSSGSTGSGGSAGTYGTAGANGFGRLINAFGEAPSGFVALANNNLATFNGPGFTRAFESANNGVIDADYNLVYNVGQVSLGPVIGSVITTEPLFADSDYRPAAGSPVIDAGLNSAVPVGLDTDFDGNPRFMDDLAVVDTGLGTGAIVDLGAFEALGEFTPDCAADTNGDGILDNGDIGVFVNLFLSGDLAADMNGDGILDNGDISTFVAAFLAGC